MKLKQRLSALLAAVLCLALLIPASVRAEESLAEIPKVLQYNGSDFEFISNQQNQQAYHIGTAYIFAVKSGGTYYALGANLGAVPLQLNGGVLTASGGVAEVVPEYSETQKNFTTRPLPAKIGDKYLTITEMNGPLALSAEKSFAWFFTCHNSPYNTLAQFYGSITETDTSVSGCLTFKDGQFGSTQSGNVTADNLYIYQKICPHTNKEEHPAVAASCSAGGNSAHTFCPDCGSWMDEAGKRLYTRDGDEQIYMYGAYDFGTNPTGHHYVNGVCTYDPSHIALDYEPVTAGMDLTEAGYLYILAAQDSTGAWKVMDFDPAIQYEVSTGCTAVMGSDGKLRIDNTNDGTRSAAEFRIQAFPEADNMIIRVPPTAQSGDYPDSYGLWAPDDAPVICHLITDTGYALQDQYWMPGEGGHHPNSIKIRDDGIAEIRMLTFNSLIPPFTYGEAMTGNSGLEKECFFFFWNSENDIPTPNVRLFRAKVPACAVNAQIQHGAAAYSILSDREQEAVLSIVSYDGSGRMTDCVTEAVTLIEGLNQSKEDIPVAEAASYGVFLLEKDSLRPLSAKRYPLGQ